MIRVKPNMLGIDGMASALGVNECDYSGFRDAVPDQVAGFAILLVNRTKANHLLIAMHQRTLSAGC